MVLTRQREDPRPAGTRRERLRTKAVDEILTAARSLLGPDAPGSITVRAVARAVGMTPAALYRYFPCREDLLSDVCVRLYDEARTSIEAARDTAGADPAARLRAAGRELRRWALAHPAEFELMVGPSGQASEARVRAVARFAETFADAGCWARLCGLVTLEVFGHLRSVAGDGGPSIFEAELSALCASRETAAGPDGRGT